MKYPSRFSILPPEFDDCADIEFWDDGVGEIAFKRATPT